MHAPSPRGPGAGASESGSPWRRASAFLSRREAPGPGGSSAGVRGGAGPCSGVGLVCPLLLEAPRTWGEAGKGAVGTWPRRAQGCSDTGWGTHWGSPGPVGLFNGQQTGASDPQGRASVSRLDKTPGQQGVGSAWGHPAQEVAGDKAAHHLWPMRR